VQTLAFAGSALAAYVLLRRWSTGNLPAFVGGLLYGFSPYMVSSGWGHPHCTFGLLVPLIILCLDEILIRRHGSPLRWGVGTGVLAAVQFFVSDELLAELAELTALSIVLLVVFERLRIVGGIRHVATGLAAAIGTATILLAYPVWYALAGPQHGSIRARWRSPAC